MLAIDDADALVLPEVVKEAGHPGFIEKPREPPLVQSAEVGELIGAMAQLRAAVDQRDEVAWLLANHRVQQAQFALGLSEQPPLMSGCSGLPAVE